MKRIYCFLIALLAITASAGVKKTRICVIETSDVHGNYLPYDFIERKDGSGSLARIMSYVKAERNRLGEDNVLLLDNGDILQGQPTAYYYDFIDTTSTHLCAAMLNYMRYDAGTVGNHDIETGHAVYDRWTRDCQFTQLCANAINTSTNESYWKPYKIIEKGGLRIAVLGMITPGIPKWLPQNLWTGLRFDDMVETARKWMPVLKNKEKADIVIGLFHSGVGSPNAQGQMNENASLQVARQVPGFDLILCGHDHRVANRWITNTSGDSILVLNPAAGAINVARADFYIETNRKGKITAKRLIGKVENIEQQKPDETIMTAFAKQGEEVKAFVSKKIGNLSTTLSTRPAYFGSSAFVDFIHQLQLKVSGADISFAAPLSFDATIKAGDIHVSNMFNLYKYENHLYVMKLTGKEIKDFLEFSYSRWVKQMTTDADTMLYFRNGVSSSMDSWSRLAYPSYNFDSAAGIIYTVDLRKPAGEKVTISSMADGKPFLPEKTYLVAVNSYRGNGGGDLLTKGAGIPHDSLTSRIVRASDKDLRYYLMQEIEKMKEVSAEPLGQWKFIPEAWVEKAQPRDSAILFGKD